MTIKNYSMQGNIMTAAAALQGTKVPDLTSRIIKAATLCNTAAAPVAVSMYIVPDGNVPGSTSLLINTRTLAVGESYPCPELVNHCMNPGEGVYGVGNGVTFKYSAVDIT